MKWTAYLKHDMFTTVTSKEIKGEPERFCDHISDLENPKDEEIRKWFEDYLPEMSDPWEIPANGSFRIDKVDGKAELIKNSTFNQNNEYELEVTVNGQTFTFTSAAPIRLNDSYHQK